MSSVTLAQAHQAFAQGDLAGALRIAETLIAREPASAPARQLAAVIERRLGRLEPARAHFEAALRAAPRDPHILNSFANLLRDLGELEAARTHYQRAIEADPGQVEPLVNLALVQKRLGDPAGARASLAAALQRAPGHPRALQSQGVLFLEEGELEPAAAAFDRVLAADPRNRPALLGRARVEEERGGDALAWLARARSLAPADASLALAEAAAIYRGGDTARAEPRLEGLVAAEPGFAAAHAALAGLRWERGDGARFTESYETALAARPDDGDLWWSYFGTLMRAGKPQAVLDRLDGARRALGGRCDGLEAAAATEAGDIPRADALFARLDPAADPGLQIAYLRHLLRAGRPDRAAGFAAPIAERPGGDHAWPYLATAWRLLDDPRWRWLEGDPAFVRSFDLPIGAAELAALADLLRTLHRTRQAPYDQTLRGGTQTQGSLLARDAPEIVRLRALLSDAVADYVAGLPPPDPGHPLLRRARAGFRFAGSWSVRLLDAGFHTHHVHTTGWISSAFYVATPPGLEGDGADRAGWLTFGEPPAELGLALAPFHAVAPKPGRLALFPSTLWHGTRPFPAGERLTVAFDVVPRGA